MHRQELPRRSMARRILAFLALLLWKFPNILIAIIGAAGVPDDVETWQRWLDRLMHDPTVLEWAERAAHTAEFINQWWVRALLVAIAVAGMFWGWRPFRRRRRRLGARWRQAVGTQTWIQEHKALELVRASNFAQSRRPSGTITKISWFAFHETMSQIAPTKESILLERFAEMVRKQIISKNPSYQKQAEGEEPEYLKEGIEKWLQLAFDQDVQASFGVIPTISTDG